MTNRHADSVTIDHVIALRREILRLEKRLEDQARQLNNALDVTVTLKRELDALRSSDHQRLQVLQDGERASLSVGDYAHRV